MSFPEDWPGRWWLGPGEVAAYLSEPDQLRPVNSVATPLIFEWDDGNLWGFRFQETRLIYDPDAESIVNIDRGDAADDDQKLRSQVYAIAKKLRGGDRWTTLTRRQQVVLNIVAYELAKKPAISGPKLRAETRKELGIDLEEARALTKSLQPRFVAEVAPDQFAVTVPGLMTSGKQTIAGNVILFLMTIFDVKLHGCPGVEADPDFAFFMLDEVMRSSAFTSDDRELVANIIDVLHLGIDDPALNQINAPLYVGNPRWRRPLDFEELATCGGKLADFWSVTRKAKDTQRAWLTAPLRLAETIQQTAKMAEPPRPLQRAVFVPNGSSSPSPQRDPMLWSAGRLDHVPLSGPVLQGELERQLRLAAKVTPKQSETVPTTSGEPMLKKYDVALSFAGPDRPHAEALAERLRAANVKVFYDVYEQGALWGEDLYVHLHKVYFEQARFCVMFLSKDYAERLWTNHERKSAQARAFTERGGAYILPVKIDDTEIPAIPPTIGYLSISMGIEKIAELLIQKLRAAD